MKYYLCITPFFPEPDNWRGSYVYDQVRAIERVSDYKVIVIKPTSFLKKENDYEFEGIKVYRCIDYTIPSNIWPNRLCDKLSAKSLVKKIDSLGIDINEIAICHCHVTNLGAYANALKLISPNILTIVQHHGFDVMGVTDGRLAKYKFHERQCIRHGVRICNEVDLNIGVSQKTLDYVLSQPGIHLKKQYVLYNGVDTSLFYPIEDSEKNIRFTIGCIANFWPLKDQITLIKAIELLVKDGITNIHCIFIGTGATMTECKSHIYEHKLSQYFEFRTEVQHSELPNFYRSLDLFVLPSYWEAFGCVYTEAYACGVPFIACKHQGISEIIDVNEVDKWLIYPFDNNKLAELIINYINNKESQHLVCTIDINVLIRQFLDVIK